MRKLVLIFLVGLSGCNNPGQPITNADFDAHIKPITTKRCFSCHGQKWNDYKNVLDNLDKIEYKVIKTRQMPPGGLPEEEFTTFKAWIDRERKNDSTSDAFYIDSNDLMRYN